VLHPPTGFTDGDLVEALARHWHVTASSVEYQAVGFGSHNWKVEPGWFAKVDEDRDFERLAAAFRSAADVPFAIAPMPTREGEPLVRVGRFGVALYPYVEGESFTFGDYRDPAHRRAALDMVVEVHQSPARHAFTDDFTVPEATITGDEGPYARPAAQLLARHAPDLDRLRTRYETLVARVDPTRMVLTHGEPHPGNTMLTAEGWRLIDWDTALIAPPERDLWHLATPDTLAAYEEATGVCPDPEMLELYRIQWDLTDLVEVTRVFSRLHTASPNEAQSWEILQHIVTSSR
jgi:spectinomycin phosphotransferase/16S rRNA (guanine(1405)-N(7))-methyltransferase